MDVLSKESVKLTVNGQEIEIGEIKMKHVKVMQKNLGKLGKIAMAAKDGDFDVEALISNGYEAVESVIKTMTGKDSKFTDELSTNQVEAILSKIIEVNEDSFLYKTLVGAMAVKQPKD